jgi:hypothetical protein
MNGSRKRGKKGENVQNRIETTGNGQISPLYPTKLNLKLADLFLGTGYCLDYRGNNADNN